MRQRPGRIGCRVMVAHRLGHRGDTRQVGLLRMAADEQHQPDRRQRRAQPRVPQRRAFAARRRIAPRCGDAGVAECHRHDGNAIGVEKARSFDTDPAAQPVTAGVGPRDAAGMGTTAGRLADDQQPRATAGLDDRAGAERQRLSTDLAGAQFGKQRCDGQVRPPAGDAYRDRSGDKGSAAPGRHRAAPLRQGWHG